MKRFFILFLVCHEAIGQHAASQLRAAARFIITEQARHIFRAKCLDCHGGLNGPDPHHMFGNNGFPKPGREPVTRHTTTVPVTNRLHMPPSGAEQLDANEIAVITEWARQRTDTNIPTSVDDAVRRGMFRRENLVAPATLAAQMRGPVANRPRVWNIGGQDNIRGAVNIGDITENASVTRLDAAEARLPSKNEPIVIYCGCCAVDHCAPVMRALALLHARGYTQVKVLNLEHGLSDYTGEKDPR